MIQFTSYNYVTLRVSKEGFEAQALMEMFDLVPMIIIGIETASREHMHLLLGDQKDNQNSVLRKTTKGYPEIKKILNNNGLTGNSDFAVRTADSIEKCMKYTVKDQNVLYKGFTKEVVDRFIRKSHRKFSKKEYGDLLTKLKDEYLDEQYDEDTFISKVIDLRISYDMNLNEQVIITTCRTAIMKRNETYRKQFSTNIRDKICPGLFF